MKKIIYIFTLALISFNTSLGQCYPDKHNTTWYDGWISCEPSLNPNESHGLSHWIMYDFGIKTEIKAMHIWNSNVPGHTNRGMKTVTIDYSNNGEDWEELGIYTFEEATGLNTYEGFDLESFESFKTRFLLFTAINNFGGECYGISEVRFTMDSTSSSISEYKDDCFAATIYPNPFRNQTSLSISVQCNSKTRWYVTDSYGKRVIPETNIATPTHKIITINGENLSAGIYYLSIKQNNKIYQYKLVKLDGN